MGEIISFAAGALVCGIVIVNIYDGQNKQLNSQIRSLQDNQIKITTQLDTCKEGYMFK